MQNYVGILAKKVNHDMFSYLGGERKCNKSRVCLVMASEEQEDVRQKENWGKRTSLLETTVGERHKECEMCFLFTFFKKLASYATIQVKGN